jgi:hypothetical protein
LGNSLGGLYARFCIGRLFAGPDAITLTPKMFITTVCPHLGVQETLILGYGLGVVFQISQDIHRTGSQLMLADRSTNNKPLLLEMTEPKSIYMEALEKFESRIIFANYLYDSLVPYCTAAIVPYIPNPKDASEMKPLSETHPHIVGFHEDPAGHSLNDAAEGHPLFFGKDSIESTMITNLRRLSWNRVDVLFVEGPSSDPHDSLILANGRQDARDVIDFMIERFFPPPSGGFQGVLAEMEDYVHFDAKPAVVQFVRRTFQSLPNGLKNMFPF